MKHTLTPWVKQTDGKGFFWVDKLTKDGGFSICNTGDSKRAEANADFIVKACNHYYSLIDLCKQIISVGHVYEDDTIEKPSVIFSHPESKEWCSIFLLAKNLLKASGEEIKNVWG